MKKEEERMEGRKEERENIKGEEEVTGQPSLFIIQTKRLP